MPISQQQTMTASAVRPLLRFIEKYDIPLNDILQDTLINESSLRSERLPISSFDKLLNNVARLTQSDDIGFITGQALELQSFGLLGFLLSTCETGRDALVTMRRYYMLLSDSPAPEIFITKNEIKVIYHISAGNDLAMRARAELIVTGIHSLGRSLGGNLYQPLKMGFKHGKPKYHEQLVDFFAVDISYNQAECWISLPLSISINLCSTLSPIYFTPYEIKLKIYSLVIRRWIQAVRKCATYYSNGQTSIQSIKSPLLNCSIPAHAP
jgi:hypothetical protein